MNEVYKVKETGTGAEKVLQKMIRLIHQKMDELW